MEKGNRGESLIAPELSGRDPARRKGVFRRRGTKLFGCSYDAILTEGGGGCRQVMRSS